MNEAFDITGKWINRLTGDTITVRNTFIDGDNMIILTADGRQISMNEFQNYIQMGDDEYDTNGHKIGSSSTGIGNIMEIEKERRVTLGHNNNISKKVIDNSFEDPFEKQIDKGREQKIKKKVTKEISESEKLLNKLFEKINLDVDVKIDLNCTNFPTKELNMLQMIYDVTIEDISNYIIKNVINEEAFRSAVSTYIKKQLS